MAVWQAFLQGSRRFWNPALHWLSAKKIDTHCYKLECQCDSQNKSDTPHWHWVSCVTVRSCQTYPLSTSVTEPVELSSRPHRQSSVSAVARLISSSRTHSPAFNALTRAPCKQTKYVNTAFWRYKQYLDKAIPTWWSGAMTPYFFSCGVWPFPMT